MSSSLPHRTCSAPTLPTPNSPPRPPPIQRHASAPHTSTYSTSIRHHVKFSERRFNTETLPADLQRVYAQLKQHHDEDYALTFVFIVRTAVELHRAWHLTLLTSKLLQLVKTKFDIRCSWNLGVIRLVFRVDDGGLELHRKVPYDYDSEFQDLYMKIAMALCEGHISIHEALIYQSETKQGLHTAPSGLFLRDNPGRLILYPLEAATCAVIFFGGDWMDAAVAALCGLAAGLWEWALVAASQYFETGEPKILIDVVVGLSTGLIGGWFERYYQGEDFCLYAIFSGTLYWFFYGTAFVIGLMEIVVGELETGVTRFIAVSVKTFVLSICSTLGLMMAVQEKVFEAWIYQFSPKVQACNAIDLSTKSWRIPLYLLCSASALGQYRFPIANYWRGLSVQLVGYEVQYQMLEYLKEKHGSDFLDTAASNVAAAACSVVAASLLRFLVDECGRYYTARLLHRHVPNTCWARLLYSINVGWMKLVGCLHLGRRTRRKHQRLEEIFTKGIQEIKDPNHPRQDITLSPDDEKVLVEAIVESNGLNMWSLLMPAVYQLVPGAMLARFWYNVIFPPPLTENVRLVGNTMVDEQLTYTDTHKDPSSDRNFFGLLVQSLSLALGLIIGQCVVTVCSIVLGGLHNMVSPRGEETPEETRNRKRREKFKHQGVADNELSENDPADHGGQTNKKTDAPLLEESINVPKDVELGLPKLSTVTTPTYVSTPERRQSSVRLRPLNQGVVLLPVEEHQPQQQEHNKTTNGGSTTVPALATVVLEKAMEEGFEIADNEHNDNNGLGSLQMGNA